jgi:hypothetical protein
MARAAARPGGCPSPDSRPRRARAATVQDREHSWVALRFRTLAHRSDGHARCPGIPHAKRACLASVQGVTGRQAFQCILAQRACRHRAGPPQPRPSESVGLPTLPQPGRAQAARTRMPCRKARECCTGTAWMAYCAPAHAAAALVVATTLLGSSYSCAALRCRDVGLCTGWGAVQVWQGSCVASSGMSRHQRRGAITPSQGTPVRDAATLDSAPW